LEQIQTAYTRYVAKALCFDQMLLKHENPDVHMGLDVRISCTTSKWDKDKGEQQVKWISNNIWWDLCGYANIDSTGKYEDLLTYP
jgi:hypothetical protein